MSTGKPRSFRKCSACRKGKNKCTPLSRVWNTMQHDRCDRCVSRSLSCGPNYKHQDDPKFKARKAINSAIGAASDIQQGSSPLAPETTWTGSWQIPSPSLPSQSTDGYGMSADWLSNSGQALDRDPFFDIEDPVLSEINMFDVLATIVESGTSASPTASLPSHGSLPYMNSIKEDLHFSFVNIYRSAIQAYEQSQYDRARWIFLHLTSALNKHPELYEARKGDTLSEMATYLGRLGHQSVHEDLLEKLTSMNKKLSVASDRSRDLCQRLAGSLKQSSDTMGSHLAEIWEKGNTCAPPANLSVPALVCAARNGNPDVVRAILPPRENELAQLLDASIKDSNAMRTAVDVRDFQGRTPLFVAATRGHYEVCDLLLDYNADCDSRDSRGHTVLGMAVWGGHEEIVELLLRNRCEVNPQIADPKMSSPIQAAVEADLFKPGIVKRLVKQHADVWQQREDGKTAIDLAEDRGLLDIALEMRTSSTPPNYGGSFNLGWQDDNQYSPGI